MALALNWHGLPLTSMTWPWPWPRNLLILWPWPRRCCPRTHPCLEQG